jgi:AcrR family transcriptional regulator
MVRAVTSKRADRRTQFLDAAVRVIARVGARSMRVEDVAREAGASTPLVYYYFDNRHELLTEAFGHANAALLGPEPVDDGSDARERMISYLLSEITTEADTSNTWAFWSELAASAVFDESLRKPINDAYEGWAHRVSLLIAEGQRDGSIDGSFDALATAETLTALMDGLSSRWILGGLDDERAERLARAAIAQVIGDRPTRRG